MVKPPVALQHAPSYRATPVLQVISPKHGSALSRLIASCWQPIKTAPIGMFGHPFETPRLSSPIRLQDLQRILSLCTHQPPFDTLLTLAERYPDGVITEPRCPVKERHAAYVAYCNMVGAEPQPLDWWYELRNQKHLTVTAKGETPLELEKAHNRYLASWFPSMWELQIGTKRAGFGHNEGGRKYTTLRVTSFRSVTPCGALDRKQKYSRCKKCGTALPPLNKTLVLAPSHISNRHISNCIVGIPNSEFCNGACRQLWLAKPEHQPACINRPPERPIMFFERLERAVYWPSLGKDCRLPDQKESATTIRADGFKDIHATQFRVNKPHQLTVNSPKPVGCIPYSTEFWCKTCLAYTHQSNLPGEKCVPVSYERPEYVAGFSPFKTERYRPEGNYRPTGNYAECRTARQVELQAIRERGHERRERVATFKQVEPFTHKDAWIESFSDNRVRAASAHSFGPDESPLDWMWQYNPMFRKRVRCSPASIADRVVVRSVITDRAGSDNYHQLTVCGPLAPRSSVDYRRKVNPRTCKHFQKQQWTFKDGHPIEMCPDCTTFDKARRAYLKLGGIEKPSPLQMVRWGQELKNANLLMGRAAFHKSLVWGSVEQLGEREYKTCEQDWKDSWSDAQRDYAVLVDAAATGDVGGMAAVNTVATLDAAVELSTEALLDEKATSLALDEEDATQGSVSTGSAGRSIPSKTALRAKRVRRKEARRVAPLRKQCEATDGTVICNLYFNAETKRAKYCPRHDKGKHWKQVNRQKKVKAT